MQIETWFNQDVKKAVKVQYLDGNVFSQDNNGNKIGVNLYNGEVPVEISGTVSANVLRADGATIAVAGSITGNKAWIVLPQSAYAVPGLISIVIKVTANGNTATVCAVVANVYKSSSDTIIDPGTIIPSVEALIAEIEAAIAAIPEDYTALEKSIAQNVRAVSNAIENTGLLSAEWVSGKIVSNIDGSYINSSDWSTVDAHIPIPAGAATKIHVAYPTYRVALYDSDNEFISATDPDGMDYTIPPNTASYFVVSYNSTDISKDDGRMAVRFDYPTGIVAKTEQLKNKAENSIVDIEDFKFTTTKPYFKGEFCTYLGNVYQFTAYHAAGAWDSSVVTLTPGDHLVETVHGERNPVLIEGSAHESFVELAMSGQSTDSHITICGKNLFKMSHAEKVAYESGNVRYDFDHDIGSIQVTSSGATANVPSAGASFPDDCKSVNGISGVFNNFKFKFKHDTVVAVSANCSERQFYNDLIQMRITDGAIFWQVDESGLTFTAVGGTEYGLQILTREGWSGDVTFFPQIEVGTHPTAWEKYDGAKTSLPTVGGYENLYAAANMETGKLSIRVSGLISIFDAADGEVYIEGTAASNVDVTLYNKSGTVNNVSVNYICKYTLTQDRVLCLRAVPKELSNVMYAFVTDGTNRWEDHGGGCILDGESGKEYAFAIVVYNGATVNTTLHPVFATDRYALRAYGSKNGVTTIYTDDNTIIRAVAKKQSRMDVVDENKDLLHGIRKLTGGRISKPLSRFGARKPIVTFIDDDTSSIALVERYHDLLSALNVVGNYAVETYNVDNAAGLADLLLDYEEEGFGCLYHCYYQSGDATRYWIHGHPDYNETLIKENFMRGLRRIAEYGLSNYKYWVTPYGVNDNFIVSLAKTHGMKCLFTCPSVNFATYGYIGHDGGNADRWNISRISYEPSSNDTKVKSVIDACAADKGWLTFVTHVNTWGSETTMDDRFTAIVQYCIAKGYDVVSVPEAFETFKPILYLNELL